MHITITKRMFDKMEDWELAAFGHNNRKYLRGQQSFQVSLLGKDEENIAQMRAALVRISKNTRNVKPIIEDIDNWLAIVSDGGAGSVLPKTLQAFADLAVEYIRTAPGQRLWRLDKERGEWEPFYVNFIEYEPERRNYRDRYDYKPASHRVRAAVPPDARRQVGQLGASNG